MTIETGNDDVTMADDGISKTDVSEETANKSAESAPPSIDTTDRIESAKANGDSAEQCVNRINIAAIGDVQIDHAFISNEPARPRYPFKPWTQYPATHLFSFPGGAWFSGNILQGVLNDPPFFQRYDATITADANNQGIGTHLLMAGTPSVVGLDSITFTIKSGDPQLPILIIDDDREIDLTDVTGIDLELKTSKPPKSFFAAPSLELGLINSTLASRKQFGQIEPNRIFRHFKCGNISIQLAADSFECSYFMLAGLNGPFPVRWKLAGGRSGHTMCTRSFKIVSPQFRRGHLTETRPILLKFGPTATVLHLAAATIEVLFGHFLLNTLTIDRGKLVHSPSLRNEELLSRVRLVAREDDRQSEGLPAIEGAAARNLGHRIWFYESPGDALSMQSPGHIVHTLSEIDLFKRYPDQRGPEKIYRRTQGHGIDGPDHGYPTILDEYYVDKFVPLPAVRVPTGEVDGNCPNTASHWLKPGKSGGRPSVVFIDDEGLGFCNRFDLWRPFLWQLAHLGLTDPKELVNLAFADFRQLCDNDKKKYWKAIAADLRTTWVVIKASHWLGTHKSDLWEFLANCDVLNRTLLIVSGESLRGGLVNTPEKPGIKLSKTVSWERTYEDFCAAISDERLKPATDCSAIIVRLGLEGALLWQKNSVGPCSTELWFDPSRIEGEYSGGAEPLGEMPGLTTVFAAAITRAVVDALGAHSAAKKSSPPSGQSTEADSADPSNGDADTVKQSLFTKISEAIAFGLSAGRRYFDLGYGPLPNTVKMFERLQLPLSQMFGDGKVEGCRYKGQHKFFSFRPTVDPKALLPDWTILSAELNREDRRTTDDVPLFVDDVREGIRRCINAILLGRRIVTQGALKAFRDYPMPVPFVHFNELLSVDRFEIEGLRSIRNVLKEYVRQTDRKVPLSVAVFGPPGSGKSFAVRQIAKTVAEQRIAEFTFNLGQFGSFKDITELLLEVRNVALDEEQLPLVFFDEFDSALPEAPLGWLKYFLAPMQDGKFQYNESMLSVGRSILVFAGGIASRHSDFSRRTFWKERCGTESDIYGAAKGPDFHSRLRGFLDIVGPNPKTAEELGGPPSKALSTDDPPIGPLPKDDFVFVVRRAILIRQNLERLHRDRVAVLLDRDEHAEIDRDLLDALLLCYEYSHGVRSLQAIFEMSVLYGERALSKTALPSRAQLNMHVDPSFYSILTRQYDEIKNDVVRATVKCCDQPGEIA